MRNTGIKAGISTSMAKAKKITVEVPAEILARAQSVSGEGVTGTVRRALEELAGNEVYERILQLRGTVQFSESLDQLREDRD
jgi:hypothetical protein